MSPQETRAVLDQAAGRRAAQRLAASWSAALREYNSAEVLRAVEAWVARTGQPPTLAQVRSALGAR